LITIKDKQHKLCLIDTCVISEILKNKTTLGNKIVTKFIDENYVFCYTIQKLGELKRAKDLYDEFFKYLFPMLSFLLKNYNQLLIDELNAYPHDNKENPFLFFFNPLSKENFNERIKEHLESEKFTDFFKNEKLDASLVLKDIASGAKVWRKAFPNPSKKVIDSYIKTSVLFQIKDTHPEFYRRQLNLEYTKFNSWLTISLVKYYKFYLNPMRKPKTNDLNDVLNTSALPYLDAIICENDLAEILRQIQVKHSYLKNLEIMKLTQFK